MMILHGALSMSLESILQKHVLLQHHPDYDNW